MDKIVMKINDRGFWENETPEGHAHDEGLGKALINFFSTEGATSILDVGCGHGYYLKLLHGAGFVVRGVDGNPNTPKFTDNLGLVADLSKPVYLGKYDWVLSLEVGEHIPAQYQEVFLDNLHRHNYAGVILSWAVRGQGGDGHVNCLDNDEIIPVVCSLGYDYEIVQSNNLREQCAKYPDIGWWFRQTLMVFRRKK